MCSRPNGTIRTPYNTEKKKCYRCNEEKDVIKFHSYWYQPKRGGNPYGDPVRKRLDTCLACQKKKNSFDEMFVFKEAK